MDFELTDEQRELQRVVRDVADRECPPAVVRAVAEGRDDGAAVWKAYVGLDWPGLTVPAEDGGTGLSAIELVITLEELGRAADPTPFLATTSQFVPLVVACAPDALRHELLQGVCEGRTGGAVLPEAGVRAEHGTDGWTLSGTAPHVFDADRADELAVVADTGDGPGVFVVPGAAVVPTRETAFDPTLHLAEVELDGVTVGPERAVVGPAVAGGVERAVEQATAGLAAMMVGASQRMLELVVGHVVDRKQFGVPIGSFQAVKHLAVDMLVAIERARALCHFAGLTIAEDDARRSFAASMAKAAAGDCQRVAAKHGVQLFGGLGYTWENDLQLYLRRAKAGALLLGTATEHKARVARAVVDGVAGLELAAVPA